MGFGAGVNFYAYANGNPVTWNDPSGLRADVFVFPRPNGAQGYSFSASDDQSGNLVTGRFNVTTQNTGAAIRAGEYVLTPRNHIEIKSGFSGFRQTVGIIFSGNISGNPNRHEGMPVLTNIGEPGVIVYPDGTTRTNVEIHPGRDPVTGEGGTSLGCLVCNNADFGRLNSMLSLNYDHGGAYLHMLPADIGNAFEVNPNLPINGLPGAAGGFVLYPNKVNANYAGAVYAK